MKKGYVVNIWNENKKCYEGLPGIRGEMPDVSHKLSSIEEAAPYEQVYAIANEATVLDVKLINYRAFSADLADRLTVGIKHSSYISSAEPVCYFTTSQSPSWSENKSVYSRYEKDGILIGQLTEVSFDFSSHPLWAGEVTALRFDPSTKYIEFQIAYIRLSKGGETFREWDFSSLTDTGGWIGYSVKDALTLSGGCLCGKSGLQTFRPISTEKITDAIPFRDANCTFKIGDPTADDEPATQGSVKRAVNANLLSINRGKWDATATYRRGDLVTMPDGISYLAKKDNITSEPVAAHDRYTLEAADYTLLSEGDKDIPAVKSYANCRSAAMDGYLRLTSTANDPSIYLKPEIFNDAGIGIGSFGSIAVKYRTGLGQPCILVWHDQSSFSWNYSSQITSADADGWKIAVFKFTKLKGAYPADKPVVKLRFDPTESTILSGEVFDIAWIRFSTQLDAFDGITTAEADEWQVLGARGFRRAVEFTAAADANYITITQDKHGQPLSFEEAYVLVQGRSSSQNQKLMLYPGAHFYDANFPTSSKLVTDDTFLSSSVTVHCFHVRQMIGCMCRGAYLGCVDLEINDLTVFEALPFASDHITSDHRTSVTSPAYYTHQRNDEYSLLLAENGANGKLNALTVELFPSYSIKKGTKVEVWIK